MNTFKISNRKSLENVNYLADVALEYPILFRIIRHMEDILVNSSLLDSINTFKENSTL